MGIDIFFYNIFTWLISRLPLRIVYGISDILCFLLYRVVKYRTTVVKENLKNSFPEKSDAELRKITVKFYRHLSDLMIENMLLPHITEKQIRKRCKFNNSDTITKFFDEGRSVICVTGHYANWEYLSGYQFYSRHKIIPIYKPLTNKHFDLYFKKMREKFGAEAVAMNDAIRTLLRYNSKNTLTLSLFISDQSPTPGQVNHWTKFLNQDTAVFTGVERIAQKTNFPVVFLKMDKVSRGHFVVDIELVCENPATSAPNEITEAHTRILEKMIQEKPEYWLWSHRRWKHKRETATSEN